jgi:cyclic beta-1,2-glucan synthetase
MPDSDTDPIAVADSAPNPSSGQMALGDDALVAGQLGNLAGQLAEEHTISHRYRRAPSLVKHIREWEEDLSNAYEFFGQAFEEKHPLSYTAEWLLDNFYVIQQTLRQVREDMPQSYYRQLPKLATASLQGYPRIYAVARSILEFSDWHVDLDRVMQFIRAYQRVTPLTIGELWALPTMLRLSALETLAQVVSHPDLTLKEPEDETTAPNCILSLRILATQDWKAFFEGVSRVDEALRCDPAGVYARMDFDTRNRYRDVIEELALATGWGEEEIAWEAIRLATEKASTSSDELPEEATCSKSSPPRTSHVGFYLVDNGRAQLETHLGYHPRLGVRLRRWLLNHPTLVYLGTIMGLTLVGTLALAWYAYAVGGAPVQWIVAGLLAFLPAMEVAVSLVNWIITHLLPPRILPKIDFDEGVPPECLTMVVIPALLTDASEIESLLQRLELHYLSNRTAHLRLALLTDFVDAPNEHMPEDNALLDQVKRGIQALNRKHRHGSSKLSFFYLFHRKRLWNPGMGCWMGWERKRGKLTEFNRLLCGAQNTSYTVQIGDLSVLPEVRYVLTLDADTTLPWGSACRLIGTLAHPLNKAEFAPDSDTVVAGYTVLQPRVEITPTSANRTLFAQLFSGVTALDLYTRAVSDVYQDLFGEGSYTGKGLYDVAAFERSLAGRVPDNTLLSHDLFEGLQGRTALVTDVSLVEEYPPHYLAHMHRLHRWVRGDWQLLPWLFPKVPLRNTEKTPKRFSVINHWKILDNLRRSLVVPAVLAFLVAGWLWLPGSALVWTLVGMLTSATPLVTSLLVAPGQALRRESLANTVWTIRENAFRWLLGLVFLAYETLLLLDAVGCTLVRLFITRRNLLQWTTSSHTIRLYGREKELALTWQRMGFVPLMALGLALIIGLLNPTALPFCTPLLLAWMVSPLIARWISKPLVRKRQELSHSQRQQAHSLARRTWLYFEQFVGPEDHWLPPDHFQENPRGLVAHRTSPTNIGLMLLSTLAAYDLGYIGLVELVLRLRSTFDGMSGLERYQGHFLNWYDTRTLQPLPPRYVSVVDSGNLAACLVALRQGCLEIPNDPVLRWQRWQGLLDTLGVLGEVINDLEGADLEMLASQLEAYLAYIRERVLTARDDATSWPQLLVSLLDEDWQELNRLLMALTEAGAHILDAPTIQDLRIWSERAFNHLSNARSELDLLLPWVFPLSQPPALLAQIEETYNDVPKGSAVVAAWQSLLEALPATTRFSEIAETCERGREHLMRLQELLEDEVGPPDQVQEARDWCNRLVYDIDSAGITSQGFLIGYQTLSDQAESYFQGMDFGFLFDPQRHVFHLGYNVAVEKLDSNHYDLLASEARIASIVSIAKGELPASHWLHLSRPLARINGTRVLLSWNGSMFEYLMPILLMRSYKGTLLDETCRAVVDRQIAYSHQKGVPWGISESGYYHFDPNMNYQYRGFGVPGLGFKRGLGADLVITPYASLMALTFHPQAVMQNVEHLIELGMLGHYGLYESIDYTRSRLPMGQESAIVYSYMVHHHGMSLLALANYLQDGVIVRRFHADPRIQTADLLLQEQVPQQAPVEEPPEEVTSAIRPIRPRAALEPWRVPTDISIPWVHLLSNGRYSVVITNAGSGYSRWKGVDLTRWRSDTTLDNWGTWIYIQDKDSGALWTATFQPGGSQPEEQEVLFYPHKAEFRRRDRNITVRTEVVVASSNDVEVRHITLVNHSSRPRRLALTSYGEVVLQSQSADRAHPAFNKLFIESKYLPELNALLFHRRPRSAEEEPIYLLHMLVVGQRVQVTGAYESDRAQFLGRNRTPRSPVALCEDDGWLSDTTGATLDPIMALGQEITLEPYATAQIAYVTLAAATRPEALELAQCYQTLPAITRALDLARSRTELDLHQSGLTTSDVDSFQQLLSALLYPSAVLRADAKVLAANSKGQPGLWPFAISGDYPILLVRVGSQEETSLLQDVLRAQDYWRKRQVSIDLVILNLGDVGYAQDLHEHLYRLVASADSHIWLNRRGGIFIVRAEATSEADQTLLETAARVILDGQRGSLAKQLSSLQRRPTHLPRFVAVSSGFADEELTPPLVRPPDLLFDNEWGGFSPDGREYVIYLEPGQRTPAPWVNVIANPDFGFVISEAGGGYTWAGNSGENRLTAWRNDPVSDIPSEVLYLRDEETGQVWSPTLLPAPTPAPYLIRHGAGYSIFEHHSHGLKQYLRLFAALDAPVKLVQLRLENTWGRNRRITATYYAEWVLGPDKDVHQQYIVPDFDASSHALLARNPYNEEFCERVAFLAASKEPYGLTADRTEFLGRGGSVRHPAALGRFGLAGTVRPGLDPCAALQVNIWLPPGETKEIVFLLGQGSNLEETRRLVKEYREAAQVEATWVSTNRFWDDLLTTVTVQTPDKGMDLLLNHWLLYQALSCRVWGRSALYQSSGAFGYRDQLQDVMALSSPAPDLARDHILEAGRHQFAEGDVLHWWHPPSGRGVRTRCSDDLVWLPFVVAHYVTVTGDEAILREEVPFLAGVPLEPEEKDRYGYYEATARGYSLYEHCRRALEKGLTSGRHGLPLIGSHDWNDGMSRVGIEGRGESVWLGWFLYATLMNFASICERLGDDEQAAAYLLQAQELQDALEAAAWDGEWYRRASYDDGAPLGSIESDECQIDSLAQSWAVLSKASVPERAAQAMESVAERLVRYDDRLILLFTPPFDKTTRDPGYIKGYPPGIRENGGQYTHAALWVVWAFAELGQGDRAEALFRLLNPIYHGDTPAKAKHYRVEPYVVAADIYSVPPHTGRGGWTWYTGSASWMYRLGLESILGLRRMGETLQIDPCIPGGWSGFEVAYRYGEASYRICAKNPEGVNRGVRHVMLDGKTMPEGEIPLSDDGQQHTVCVLMG